MQATDDEQVTGLLFRWRAGDRACLDRLVPLVNSELLRIAHRCMVKERRGHTLQTTALVNEAYLKLVRQGKVDCQSRSDFLGIAARVMRQILVDRARKFAAQKRGSGGHLQPFDDGMAFTTAKSASLVALDEAIQRLATLDERKAQIVELRYFGGLTVEETAEALLISRTTVVTEWSFAKAWLMRELRPKDGDGK